MADDLRVNSEIRLRAQEDDKMKATNQEPEKYAQSSSQENHSGAETEGKDSGRSRNRKNEVNKNVTPKNYFLLLLAPHKFRIRISPSPHFYRPAALQYTRNGSFRNRDPKGRVRKFPMDDRSVDIFNASLKTITIQATDEICLGSTSDSTWNRTFIRNACSLHVVLANWPLSHKIRTSDDDSNQRNLNIIKDGPGILREQGYMALKHLISSVLLLPLISFPLNAEGEMRNNGRYDPFPYRLFTYPNFTRNIKEARAIENGTGNQMERDERKYHSFLPHYLCFLGNEGEARDISESDSVPEYLFVSFSSIHYDNEELTDRVYLNTISDIAARDANVPAYWLSMTCMETDLENEVYRMSDVVRSASSVAITIRGDEPIEELLEQWGKRVWTLPEVLLCDAKKPIKVYALSNTDYRRVQINIGPKPESIKGNASSALPVEVYTVRNETDKDPVKIYPVDSEASDNLIEVYYTTQPSEQNLTQTPVQIYIERTQEDTRPIELYVSFNTSNVEVQLVCHQDQLPIKAYTKRMNNKHLIKEYTVHIGSNNYDVSQNDVDPVIKYDLVYYDLYSLAKHAWRGDEMVSRQLIDHFRGNLGLSRLELSVTALECLYHRELTPYFLGDHAYVLMGLTRIRPTVGETDNDFQAFARISLANDNDLLLERLACVLPKEHDQDWHDMTDAYGAKLWDIYPYCQIAGVGGSGEMVVVNDTVIMPGDEVTILGQQQAVPIKIGRNTIFESCSPSEFQKPDGSQPPGTSVLSIKDVSSSAKQQGSSSDQDESDIPEYIIHKGSRIKINNDNDMEVKTDPIIVRDYTIVVDGARAAAVKWDNFEPVYVQRPKSSGRVLAKWLLHTSVFILIVGAILLYIWQWIIDQENRVVFSFPGLNSVSVPSGPSGPTDSSPSSISSISSISSLPSPILPRQADIPTSVPTSAPTNVAQLEDEAKEFVSAMVNLILHLDVIRVLGIIFVVWAALLTFLSPLLLRYIYGGEFSNAQPWLFGFEGYLPIEHVESMIFGNYQRRLRWHPFGSPLSQHYANEFNECIPRDPYENEETKKIIDNAKNSGPGEPKIFTLVDTYTMTVTIFEAIRPPIVFLLLAQEGACSAH